MDQPRDEQPTVEFHPEATAAAGPTPGAPVAPPLIVVQYRRNWSATLVPPALIVLIAVLLLQLRAARTSTPSAPRPSGESVVPVADAQPRGPSPLASPSPAVVVPPPFAVEEAGAGPSALEATADEPAPIVATEPVPVLGPPPVRPRPAIGFVRPTDREPANQAETAAIPGVPREGLDVAPPDPPTEEEVSAQLADSGPTEAEEALAIRERRQALVGLKDRLLVEDRRQGEIHKVEEAQRLKTTIEEGRAEFLRELGRTLKERGSSAGPEIVALCARYGRTIPKESEVQAHKVLKTANGNRLEPKARVELLRGLGWPEAMILDELAHVQAREIGRRNGPKNRGEALAAAARILLTVPLQHSAAALGPGARPNPPRPLR